MTPHRSKTCLPAPPSLRHRQIKPDYDGMDGHPLARTRMTTENRLFGLHLPLTYEAHACWRMIRGEPCKTHVCGLECVSDVDNLFFLAPLEPSACRGRSEHETETIFFKRRFPEHNARRSGSDNGCECVTDKMWRPANADQDAERPLQGSAGGHGHLAEEYRSLRDLRLRKRKLDGGDDQGRRHRLCDGSWSLMAGFAKTDRRDKDLKPEGSPPSVLTGGILSVMIGVRNSRTVLQNVQPGI